MNEIDGKKRGLVMVLRQFISMPAAEISGHEASRFVTIQQHIVSILRSSWLAGDCVYFPPQTGSTDGLDKDAGKF
jgi:hypothetical protein